MKKILAIAMMLFFCSVPAWGMTLEQMKELAGGNMMNESMRAVVQNYGVPALIVDHGIGLGKPKQKVKIVDKSIALTSDNWNFIYAPKQNYIYTSAVKEKDPRFWINPNPIMPGGLKGVENIVFFSFGGKSNLESHQICSVYADFVKDLPASLILAKFGEPEEFTQNDDFEDIARYWIPLYGTSDYPYKLFAVDFHLYEEAGEKYFTSYTISADSVDFVDSTLAALQDRWQNGSEQDESIDPDNQFENSEEGEAIGI